VVSRWRARCDGSPRPELNASGLDDVLCFRWSSKSLVTEGRKKCVHLIWASVGPDCSGNLRRCRNGVG